MGEEMTVAEFEEVTGFYYMSGDGAKALSAFKYLLNHSELDVAIKTGSRWTGPIFFLSVSANQPSSMG